MLLPLLAVDLPPSQGSMYLLVLAAALPSIVGLVVTFVQWMGKRTIDREDKDKEELKATLKEHEERFERTDRGVNELKSFYERRFGEMDHALVAVQGEDKHVLSVAEGIRGAVTEMKSAMDNRFEKQGDFYRTSLKEQTSVIDERIDKLEQDLRHDMTRAVADSLRGRKR